jgi:hypothetical protein
MRTRGSVSGPVLPEQVALEEAMRQATKSSPMAPSKVASGPKSTSPACVRERAPCVQGPRISWVCRPSAHSPVKFSTAVQA